MYFDTRPRGPYHFVSERFTSDERTAIEDAIEMFSGGAGSINLGYQWAWTRSIDVGTWSVGNGINEVTREADDYSMYCPESSIGCAKT